jgi:tetratricopeptide (TPR) repeat protein
MKKFVFASVMALASLSLVYAPTLRAQDQQGGTIQIKDPAEYNAYSMATTQSDPKAKAAAIEDFLTKYPQSVVKKTLLDTLIDTYQGLGDLDHALSAATRMLQIDPDNLKAIYFSVYVKKGQCAKTSDQQACDDTVALAQKGLNAKAPAGMSPEEFKKQTDATAPFFHSAIATADMGKKDPAGAVEEYKKELMLYPPDATQKGPGLGDTLQLALAYVKLQLLDAQAQRDAETKAKATPGDATLVAAAKAAKDKAGQDYVQACWFFARAWNFAPANFKGQIEPQLEYYFKKYHGDLTGLDTLKSQAAATLFPPGTLNIAPAKTPEEQIHDLLASTSDWNTLALADKETVLSVGSKEDADKLWATLQGKDTPVPGTVIESNANQVKVAVTQDSKDAKTADFIVNMKEPIPEKEIPAVGSELKLLKDGGPELDGTYDTYTQVPASSTAAASAQIVLKDGLLQSKKAPVHKPAAAHHTTTTHKPQQ